MWASHPTFKTYQANAITGEIKGAKGVRIIQGGYLTLRYEKKVIPIDAAKFVFECFNGLIEQQYTVDLEDVGKGLILSNLVKVTENEKLERHLVKIEAERTRLEMTDMWKTHPWFTDYLGSKKGEVYSLKSSAVIKGQKKKPYRYIAMYLTKCDEDVYITQHKFIYECFNGLLDATNELSHINQIEDDNAISNLKLLKEEEVMITFDDSRWYEHPTYSQYMADTNGNVYKTQTRKKLDYKPNKAGYIDLKLHLDDKVIFIPAHRFVYECFYGLVDATVQIDHRNTKRSQNDIRNLTALGKRAHAIKTRKDNPDMSLKRAATCSKPVLRIKMNDDGTVAETTRFESPKLAVQACSLQMKIHGISDAIRFKSVYKGYRWEYELPLDLPGEIWNTLKYNGDEIVVSNLGRIKTSYGLSYGHKNGHGYMKIGFGEHTYQVHILVCRAFHGPPPADMENPTVDHIDRERSNNVDTNLRWADRPTQGLNKSTTKKVIGFVLTDPSVTFGPFDSIRLAAKEMTVDPSSISAVCNKKRKSAGKHNNRPLGWEEITVEIRE